MAVAARSRWIGAGKPLQPARPVDEIVHRLNGAFPRGAHENLFSFYADDDHYNAVPAEDHTPYSQTGWPLWSPEWWVFATDVMHRPDLNVDCRVLFAYWIGEARAGRMPWLKYMNWQGKQYRAKGYAGETVAFRTAWANSDHFDHIHLSVRTDCRDASLSSWSLLPGGDDMAFGDEDKARLVHIEAMFTNVYGWEAEDVNLARQVPALLAAIAAKVDVDPAELEAIKQAAAAGVIGAVPLIVDAIAAKLPADTMTRDEVEQAVRDAFAGGLAPGQ